MRLNIFFLIIVFLFAGCVSSFVETQSSQPHAILQFWPIVEKSEPMSMIEINGKIAGTFKISTKYLVAPGEVVVLVKSNVSPEGKIISKVIKINVKDGSTYDFISTKENGKYVFLVEEDGSNIIYKSKATVTSVYGGESTTYLPIIVN